MILSVFWFAQADKKESFKAHCQVTNIDIYKKKENLFIYAWKYTFDSFITWIYRKEGTEVT